ncbi:MAG TPA: hypothetical protein VFH44_08215 [Solirubrobacterales bacterium]|nr:hypothetical protein [Solirubrobacterales bacterium]
MRATLRDGELTLVPRPLATVSGGPIGCLARAALPPDASVADLRFGIEDEPAEDLDEDGIEAEAEDEDEEEDAEPEDRTVEVRFLANDRPDARRALKRWAARTGHERIWFRDEVSELEAPAGIDGEYGTTCPACGLEITDSGPDLMGFVHKVGHFPLNCFVCGTFVPQWTPLGNSYAADGSAGYREPAEHRALHVVGGREEGEG